MCRQGKWDVVSNHRRKVMCYSSNYLILNKFTSPDNCKILTSESTHFSIYGDRNKQGGSKKKGAEGKEERRGSLREAVSFTEHRSFEGWLRRLRE